MRARAGALVAVIAVIAGSAAPSSAAEPLEQARALYAAASFEEALTLLNGLGGEEGLTPDAMQYKALCLLALGRTREAETITESLVSRSPAFQPSQADLPPRFVGLLTDTRKRLLPAIARRIYSEGRDQFHSKNYAPALKQFEQVLLLAGDPIWKDSSDAADLRALASGFIDLARVAVAPPVVAAPAPSGPTPAASPTSPVSAPAAGTRSGVPPTRSVPAPGAPAQTPRTAPPNAPAANGVGARADSSPNDDVTPPVAIRQTLPRWMPPDAFTAAREYRGAIKVLIDATGKVVSASMERPTHPAYDTVLLRAARDWLYQPARLNGRPVGGEKVVDILLRTN